MIKMATSPAILGMEASFERQHDWAGVNILPLSQQLSRGLRQCANGAVTCDAVVHCHSIDGNGAQWNARRVNDCRYSLGRDNECVAPGFFKDVMEQLKQQR